MIEDIDLKALSWADRDHCQPQPAAPRLTNFDSNKPLVLGSNPSAATINTKKDLLTTPLWARATEVKGDGPVTKLP